MTVTTTSGPASDVAAVRRPRRLRAVWLLALLGVLVVVMVVLCAGYTVVRMRRSHAHLARPRPGTPANREVGSTDRYLNQDV